MKILLNPFFYHFCMDQASGDGGSAGGSGGQSNAGIGSKVTVSQGDNKGASASVSTTVGDAAKESQQQNSASASTSSIATGDPNAGKEGATPDFKTSLGDFAKDPIFKDIGDVQALAKSYAETKKLVGQKLGIPSADATPEAKAAFYEALGVPKDGAGYEFKEPEGLPEAMKGAYDQKNADKWAAIFKEHNVPKAAANALREAFFKEVAEQVGSAKEAVTASDEAFDKMATTLFGDKKAAAIQNANAILSKHVPKELLADLEKSGSDVALVAIAAAINGELKALTGEDNALTKDNGATGGETVAQLRQKAQDLMKDPAYNSPFAKGKDEHERLKKEVKDIYARIDAASKKA